MPSLGGVHFLIFINFFTLCPLCQMEAICVVNVPWQKEIQRMDQGWKLILLENISPS